MKHVWLIPCGPDSDPTATIQSLGPDQPIMLVNDGTDLSAFSEYKNIQIVKTESKGTGCAHALNVGIAALKNQDYDWVYRMDADDLATVDHDRDKQAAMADKDELVVAGAMATPYGRRMSISAQISDDFRSAIERRRNPVYHPATIIRLSVLLRVGGYDEQYGQAEDYALWCKMLRIGKIKPWDKIWTWHVMSPANHAYRMEMLGKAAEAAGY